MKPQHLKIYAEIEAIRIEVMGMMTENKEREINNESMAYLEDHFQSAANDIRELIDQLKEAT